MTVYVDEEPMEAVKVDDPACYPKEEQEKGYEFTDIKRLKAAPVKNQFRSGTCWSFSSISLLESEVMRLGGPELDLSEMFVVRNIYPAKARGYVRMHGKQEFAAGSLFHDVINVIREQGIVPESVYSGRNIGEDKHKHYEMDGVLRGYVDAIVRNRNGRLTPVWPQGIDGILDAYLGPVPSSFIVNGKKFTPKGFASSLGIDPDNYITIGSYTHHPFYDHFTLEVPDNWSDGQLYNLPIDEFRQVMSSAISSGYTFLWGGDVSYPGFSQKEGLAVLLPMDRSDMTEKEWKARFKKPVAQPSVTQEERQEAFDNYDTTDDHGMHAVGTAKDQNGTSYFIIKNSWGTLDRGPYDGHLYISESYAVLKATSVGLHKNAIPARIRKKLGL
ncbi:MAG: aminopeptidase [Candidatus Bathyarchaeota archaeon]|nr:aminopeptidase [Candidatus Bathyarchaeota archaeon]